MQFSAAMRTEQCLDDPRQPDFSVVLLTEKRLAAIQRNNPATGCFLPGFGKMRIGHHHLGPAIDPQVDERFWKDHSHRVKHVRVVVAVPHHQDVFAAHDAACRMV
jgi:hypothetical protein